jgi:hypothetical protein
MVETRGFAVPLSMAPTVNATFAAQSKSCFVLRSVGEYSVATALCISQRIWEAICATKSANC